MAVKKFSDLLPISDNNTKPNAYEVFGLTAGETNPETIERSVESMIAKVKAVKSETEPLLWKQIAKIVQAARVTLADPEKKSRLDARIKSASSAASNPSASNPGTSKPVDPLAGLLPPVNPIQPIVREEPKPTAEPTADDSPNVSETANPMPPGLFPTPGTKGPLFTGKADAESAKTNPPEVPITPVSIPKPPAIEIPIPTQQISVQPIVKASPGQSIRRSRKRRKSVFVPIIMSLITLSLIAVVGLLAYALFFRQETIAISSSDGSVNITTSRNDPAEAEPSPQRQPQKPLDTTMQSPAAKNETIEPNEFNESRMGFSPPRLPETPMAQMPAVPSPPINPMANTTLAELRSAIRRGDWPGMTGLAEKVNRMNLNSQQQAEAAGLLSITDLASYYRTGIERAVAELNAGDDFEVKNGFRVVVVGKTDQSLTVRYNTKMPEYTFDALPLSLAHRLATFQIPAGPSGDAAKAVYQAVAPNSTPGHRTQAIVWLGEIEDDIEGANPNTLMQTLQAIFDEN